MGLDSFFQEYQRARESLESFVVVTFVEARGSAPQEVGARLIVGPDGYFSGTIGGGKVESAAIEKSLSLLREGRNQIENQSPLHGQTLSVEWNLQTDLGMSCGGAVRLFFEVQSPKDRWNIVIFGAGHVAQELVRVLQRLECHLTVFDSRPEWLAKLPLATERLTFEHVNPLESAVERVSPRAFVVVATMGHSTDLPVLEKLLKMREHPYVGVIGSDVKARKLRGGLIERGCERARVDALRCPIGEPIGNNTPGEIAISIAAELLKVRDSL